MSRYDITNQFRERFINEHVNVQELGFTQYYVSINNEKAEASNQPYSMETAEYAIYILSYRYRVLSQIDCDMVALFFNKNGELDDFIKVDGWKLQFFRPTTGLYHNTGVGLTISKENLFLRIVFSGKYASYLVERIDKIWQLFSIARSCTTQMELNLLQELFIKEEDISKLVGEKLKLRVEKETAENQIVAYKALLDKIEALVNKARERA